MSLVIVECFCSTIFSFISAQLSDRLQNTYNMTRDARILHQKIEYSVYVIYKLRSALTLSAIRINGKVTTIMKM